jgi:fumarate reductase iron-sulfur subunit
MAEEIKITISRYNPEISLEPYEQSYTLPYRADMVVLDAVNYIKNHLDGSLTFRWSCRMGICGSCGMMVNGEPKLTCATFLSNYYRDEIRVAPLANFAVIRDLVVDMTDFMEKLREVKPWLIRREEKPLEEGEYMQSPDQLKLFQQFSMCIGCMICYAACPVYGNEPRFIGPAAIALAHRYDMDSRDRGRDERAEVIGQHEGIWECTSVGECSKVCPQGVAPAAAIQRSKLKLTQDYMLSMLWPWRKR